METAISHTRAIAAGLIIPYGGHALECRTSLSGLTWPFYLNLL